MNLKAFQVLYGKDDSYTLEQKVAKNGMNYIIIKRPCKGEGYIASTPKLKTSSRGIKANHGVIIWFNENRATVKPITCQTYKSAKGFSRKHFKKLAKGAYHPSGGIVRPSVEKMRKYIKDKLNDVPFRAKFKIHKPKIIVRNCKNGKTQALRSTWYLESRNKIHRYYTVKSNDSIEHDIRNLLNGIVPKIHLGILSKMLTKMMYQHVKNVKEVNNEPT